LPALCALYPLGYIFRHPIAIAQRRYLYAFDRARRTNRRSQGGKKQAGKPFGPNQLQLCKVEHIINLQYIIFTFIPYHVLLILSILSLIYIG